MGGVKMKKKEAIKLFGIALWGYALPRYKQIFKESGAHAPPSESYLF